MDFIWDQISPAPPQSLYIKVNIVWPKSRDCYKYYHPNHSELNKRESKGELKKRGRKGMGAYL